MKKRKFHVKFYNSWPVNERDIWEPEDEEDKKDIWCWAILLLPTIKVIHDTLFGKRIAIGFLFWSINIVFEESISS